MSLFCSRLKFRLRRSVKSSARLFKKSAYIVGLENFAAKENSCCSSGRDLADHIQSLFVRGTTASTQHQDGDGTLFYHRTHGGCVPAVIRFNSIRTKLGSHSSVKV